MHGVVLLITGALILAHAHVCASKPGSTNPGQAGPPEAAAAAMPPSPYLFKISRPGFTAYVLPESHVGSPLEFGPHYHSAVLPAARRSRVIVHEGASLDAFPGSRHWGRTCLDDQPRLAALGPELVQRIAAHHRYSQWADLRRAFAERGDAFAEEQFTTFIGARGLLLNFLELDSRIGALLERELAMVTSTEPAVTSREFYTEHGASSRITRAVPRLRRESIETLDDEASAICALPAPLQHEAVAQAVQSFDGIRHAAHTHAPGTRFEQVEAVFRLLGAQLRQTGIEPSQAIAAGGAREQRPQARVPVHHLPGLSRGRALDMLKLGLRNQRWAERIDEHARARRQGLFYVLGAAHLLDFEDFDGLLTLLRQRGFRIEVVRQLPAGARRGRPPPPHPPFFKYVSATFTQ